MPPIFKDKTVQKKGLELGSYLAISFSRELSKTVNEDLSILCVLTPRIMRWNENIWLLDLRPCVSYWVNQAKHRGVDVVFLIRMILHRQLLSKEWDVDYFSKWPHHFKENIDIMPIGNAANYTAILASDPWQAVLCLNHAVERKSGGLIHLAGSAGLTLCQNVSWGSWWKAVDAISSHFEVTSRKGYSLSKFYSQCAQMKRATHRLGIKSPWHLRHAESLAVGRRFGLVIQDLWVWTWANQVGNNEGRYSNRFSDIFASDFPWRIHVFNNNPTVQRCLETPLVEWNHVLPFLEEDLDKMCDLDSWDFREKIVCLEWKVVTYDMTCLTIPICFRHPHSLASERNTSFATTTLQASYAFYSTMNMAEKHRDCSDDLQTPALPIISWSLEITERLHVYEPIKSLFDDHTTGSADLLRLENKLPLPLESYDVCNDSTPEGSFSSTTTTSSSGVGGSHRLDCLSNRSYVSLCAQAYKRPLFLYKNPELFDQRRGTILWCFLERVMNKWWEQSEEHGLFQRDYYQVVDRKNQFQWVFRDLNGRWYLHGIFA